MATSSITVEIGFGIDPSGGSLFVLDDPVRGVLDSASFTLASDLIDVGDLCRSFTIDRGRQRLLDDFVAGTAQVVLDNRDRRFDDTYASGPYAGLIDIGLRIQITCNGITLFFGSIEDWDLTHDVNGDSVAIVSCVDMLGVLAMCELDAWTPTAGQLVGARISAALDRTEVSFPASRAIGAGVSTLSATPVAAGTNTLNYCQQASESDLGYFYASRTGELTFKDRLTVTGTTIEATFGQDLSAGDIPYMELGRSVGSDLCFNRVRVTWPGGEEIAEDVDSTDTRRRRSKSLDVLVEDATQAGNMADFLVGKFALPESRFAMVRTDLGLLTDAQAATLLGLDITSAITVSLTPNDIPPALERTSIVEGVHHEWTAGDHVVALDIGDAVNRFPFILDDPVLGVLDGTGLLAF